MAGGNASPRQKMINMMYLVLTALLALNVSKEVLDAFVKVNISLNQQNEVLVSKNSSVYGELQNQLTLNPEDAKYQDAVSTALKLNEFTQEVITFLGQMKVDLLKEVEGVDEAGAKELLDDPFKVNKKDDYDAPTHFFGTSEPPGDKGRANEIKQKLQEFRDRLLKLVNNDPRVEERLTIMNLSDPDPESQTAKIFRLTTWELQYFYHLPLSAALLELAKWENIVRGAEADVLNFIWDQISAGAFKFDAVTAKVVPRSTFVTAGSAFEAEVFLAAYNTTVKPTIIYGSAILDTLKGEVANATTLDTSEIDNGIGIVRIPASGTGERTFTGVIQMLKPGTSELIHYPFGTKYMVSPPSASVAATKMNVFYVGLDNPVSVSVPGFAPNQLIVTGSGAISISGSNGTYTVKASAPGTAKVNVSVKDEDGKTINMGTQEFRLKTVPTPIIKWAGKKTGELVPAGLGSASPLIPEMENFDFEVYSRITGFKVTYFSQGIPVEKESSSNVIPPDAASAIRSMRRGQKVYFDDIQILLPSGERRKTSASFVIQ